MDLKIIEVSPRPVDAEELLAREALDTDVSTIIRESCKLVDAETKEVLAYYIHSGFEEREALAAIKSMRYDESTRTGGLKTTSRVFGFAPRVPLRKDFCSATKAMMEDRKAHAEIEKLAMKATAVYKESAPQIFAAHEEMTKRVLPEWYLPGTPFTSGIVNKNNQLNYHFDRGNFKNVYSAMFGFKYQVKGGHLNFPGYDCALAIGNGSLTIFEGQNILHGVTPFKLLSPEAYRYTVVFYSLEGMKTCLPAQEELKRIRNLKTTREKNRL